MVMMMMMMTMLVTFLLLLLPFDPPPRGPFVRLQAQVDRKLGTGVVAGLGAGARVEERV